MLTYHRYFCEFLPSAHAHKLLRKPPASVTCTQSISNTDPTPTTSYFDLHTSISKYATKYKHGPNSHHFNL